MNGIWEIFEEMLPEEHRATFREALERERKIQFTAGRIYQSDVQVARLLGQPVEPMPEAVTA